MIITITTRNVMKVLRLTTFLVGTTTVLEEWVTVDIPQNFYLIRRQLRFIPSTLFHYAQARTSTRPDATMYQTNNESIRNVN
jgi:hypothetical protein